MLAGKVVLQSRDPTETKDEKSHTLKSQKPGKWRTQFYKHICTQLIPAITFPGLVKQLFSKQCLERKFRNTTSPTPVSNIATI